MLVRPRRIAVNYLRARRILIFHRGSSEYALIHIFITRLNYWHYTFQVIEKPVGNTETCGYIIPFLWILASDIIVLVIYSQWLWLRKRWKEKKEIGKQR